MRDLVHNSPALRHRRELFATGLIDNPRCPCDLAERRKLRVHLLNLRDGSPYHPLPSDTIVWESAPRVRYMMNDLMVITGSRVMICGYYWDNDLPSGWMVQRMSVWDWKTGDLVTYLWFEES